MSPKAKRVFHWALTIATIALLGVLARKVDWPATLGALRGADPRLLAAAVAVNFLGLGVKALSWWVFLRPIGARSVWLAVRAAFAGSGLNNVLPANGGDAARVVFVTRATGVPPSTALATIALDRLFDLVGYVLFLGVAPLVIPLPDIVARWRWAALGLLIPLGGFLFFLLRRGVHHRASGHVLDEVVGEAVPHSLWAQARRHASHFSRSVSALATGPRFFWAAVLTLGFWASQVVTFAIVARAAGLRLPLAGHVATALAVNVSFLLRPTPGNVGFFQLVYALTAAAFGVPRHNAIAVALLIQALQIVPTTVVGIALAPEFVFGRARTAETAAD